MSQAEIMTEVRRLAPSGLVEITGGEPMLQEREVVPLMREFLAAGYTVLLETSGERPLAAVPPEVHKIVDVKCPASGEGGTFRDRAPEVCIIRNVHRAIAGRDFGHSVIRGNHEVDGIQQLPLLESADERPDRRVDFQDRVARRLRPRARRVAGHVRILEVQRQE